MKDMRAIGHICCSAIAHDAKCLGLGACERHKNAPIVG